MRCNDEHLAIIDMATGIDEDLASWASNVPPQIKFDRIYGSRLSGEMFSTYYDVYSDYYVGGLWNAYRSTRVIALDILLEELQRLHELSVPGLFNGESPYSSQIRIYRLVVQELIHDIYACVPQYLDQVPGVEETPLNPFRAAVGVGFLLWPLYVSGCSTYVPWTTRMWAAKVLDTIAARSGIRQASFLAQAVRDGDEITEHLIEDVTQLPESDPED